MKILNYVDGEGESIVIQQPTDIYPLLNWCQDKMIEKQRVAKGTVNIEKWEKAINFLGELLETVEDAGFGSLDDIDNIEYD